jgi:hypothetical protein
MELLRRIFGDQGTGPAPSDEPAEPAEANPSGGGGANLDALERERELDLLRGDQERLDELQQRQLRYASYAWQPPAQGGELRAEDNDPPRS